MNGISGQYGSQPMREGDCVPRGREEPIMWQDWYSRLPYVNSPSWMPIWPYEWGNLLLSTELMT